MIIEYNWISSASIIYTLDSSVVKIISNNPSWHYVEVLNNVGCVIKDSIFINVYSNPEIDSLWASNYNVPYGSSTELNVLTDDSVFWFNASGSSTIEVFPNTSLWYTVTTYNGFCEVKDSIYISVREVFCNQDSIIVPSGFTPNYDGINDVYKIKNKGVDVVKFNFSI